MNVEKHISCKQARLEWQGESRQMAMKQGWDAHTNRVRHCGLDSSELLLQPRCVMNFTRSYTVDKIVVLIRKKRDTSEALVR